MVPCSAPPTTSRGMLGWFFLFFLSCACGGSPSETHARDCLSESLGRAVVEAQQRIDIWLGVEHLKVFWSLTGPNKFDGDAGVFTNG